MKQIKLTPNRIEVYFPYSAGMVKKIKEIPGSRFDGVDKCWWFPKYPVYAKTLVRIGNEHGFSVDIDLFKLAKHIDTKKELDRTPLYNYQYEGVDFLHKNNGTCILADDMGCISGEAEIIINRGGAGRKYSLETAYKRFHGLDSKYTWDRNIPTFTRSIDEQSKDLRLNEIIDIIFSGVKDTIEIDTFDGYKLRLTPDHEILTNNGWVRADALSVGSIIYANGISICPICGTTEDIITYKYSKYKGYCRKCMYAHKRNKKHPGGSMDADGYIRIYGMFCHPYATIQNYVVQHRLVYESYLNNVSYNKWISMCQYGFDDGYEFLSSNVIIHHKNGNKADNRIENLLVMSTSDHAHLHGDPNRLSLFMQGKETIVKSVGVHKDVPVYDIIMKHPYRSFVASSIVVHNCGKTIEALWYGKEASIKRMLVVCPASVIYKWKAEAERWGGYSAEVIATTKTEIPLDTNVIIMSYAILLNKIKSGGELPKMFWELIIADEAHHLKDKDAKTTLAFCKLMGARRLFLSGTPLLNRPIELFSLLNQINPSKWNNYYVFAHRYCDAHQVEIYTRGGKRIKYLDVSGSSNLDELREELKPIMLRRLKQEVISELPDLSRVVVPLDISNKSEYNRAHKDFKAWLEENGKKVTPNALSELNYLRQLVGHGKVKATVDLAEDIMQSDVDRKLVIYAHHKEVIKKLKMELKQYGVATIIGDDSPKEREASIQAFQNKILPRIMLISEAGGEGVDLFRADTIIFTERAWNGAKENQAEARLHRIGQKNAVTAYYLVARKTIDEKIHELVELKRDIFDAVIGDASIYQEIIEMFE